MVECPGTNRLVANDPPKLGAHAPGLLYGGGLDILFRNDKYIVVLECIGIALKHLIEYFDNAFVVDQGHSGSSSGLHNNTPFLYMHRFNKDRRYIFPSSQ